MKKRLLTIAAVLYFLPIIALSQAIQWQNTIGGDMQDLLYSIEQTADGGYIIIGSSESSLSSDKTEDSIGGWDCWILKTDSAGIIQWQNTIGGIGDETYPSIQQTADGGFILGTSSNSDISGDKNEICQGLNDYWIIKLDSAGVIQWQNTIGGSGSDVFSSILQTSDGGYMISGYSDSNISGDKTEDSNGGFDFWIVKTDSSGVIQWQNTIGGSSSESLNNVSLPQTLDGGFILGGTSTSNISGDKTENSNGSTDFWIVKIDSSGIIQWQNTIGGAGQDILYTLQQTLDGGYILGGMSNSNISGDKNETSIGLYDYWMIKTDSSGVIIWQNTIGGSSIDRLKSIQQTNDGGYILGGYSNSNISGDKNENCLGLDDYWIVKTDSAGVIQWQNTIGGIYQDSELNSIRQTDDEGYIMGGYSNSNISGDKTENCNGGVDYWIIKIFEQPTSISETIVSNDNLQLYPNPANSILYIATGNMSASACQITITDVAGRIIFSKQNESSSSTQNIDISSLSQGIYFLQVEEGAKISRGRFVKE